MRPSFGPKLQPRFQRPNAAATITQPLKQPADRVAASRRNRLNLARRNIEATRNTSRHQGRRSFEIREQKGEILEVAVGQRGAARLSEMHQQEGQILTIYAALTLDVADARERAFDVPETADQLVAAPYHGGC